MWLMPLTASHVMQQCKKSHILRPANRWSQQGATWRRAAASNTATMTPYATCDVSHVPATPMSVICQAIMQYGTHCTPLYSSCCSIKLHRPTWTCQWPTGPIVALRGEASFSPQLNWHHLPYGKMCDPHINRPPPDFKGAKLSQIFRLVCEYIR